MLTTAKWPACAYPSTKRKYLQYLFIITLFSLFIQSTSFANIQGITLSLKNAPLRNAFKEITIQSGISFLYTEQLLDGTTPVTADLKNVSLEFALNTCLHNQGLAWQLINGTIVLSKKMSAPLITNDTTRIVNGLIFEGTSPLAGASIIIKGTSKGTFTKRDGTFSLRISESETKLVVSRIGFGTQEMEISGRNYIQLVLAPVVNKLDEAVVIGYGTTTKRLSTGSVSRITSKEIENQPVSNSLAAMTGRLAGVYITQQTGVPGGNFTVQIRGKNSLRDEGNSPLYIVDGVPYASSTLSSTYVSGAITQQGNPLSSFNPADIESIEILKDADATSIYGSRGANGVVLITTKKVHSQQTHVTINFSAGWGKLARTMELMNTEEYLLMRHEGFRNDQASPGFTDYDLNGTWDTARSTNWQKELLGNTAHLTNTQISFSNDNEQTQWLLSGAHRKESSVFPGNNSNEKMTAHFSLNHSDKNNRFKLSLSTLAGKEISDLPQLDLYITAISLPPVAPALYDSLGNLNWENSTWENPLSYLQRKYSANTVNFLVNGMVSYELLPGLTAKAGFGYTALYTDEKNLNPHTSFRPSYGIQTSYTIFNKGNLNTTLFEPQITYRKNTGFGSFTLLAGSTLQRNEQEQTAIYADGYTSPELSENLVAAPVLFMLDNTKTVYRYAGIFGRIGYDYHNTFLLNISGRRDGSSRFAPGKQFGNFGAVGAGIVFSNIEGFRDILTTISFAKVKMSYGTSGNDQIGDYSYLNSYSPVTYNYNGISGLMPTSLYSPDYSWELNKKTELGIDLGFFKDQLLLSANYYSNISSNQLVGYFIAPTTGFSSIQSNLPAKVKNSGWEFDVQASSNRNKKVFWSGSVNISFPRSKLISFPGIKNSFYDSRYEVGRSMQIRKLFHVQRVNSNTGLFEFEDSDKNGNSFDVPGDIIAGIDLTQKFHGGLQNSMKFYKFQLDLFVQFVKQTGSNFLTQYNNIPGSFNNQPKYVLDRWKQPGDKSEFQRFSTGADGIAALNYYYAISQSDLAFGDASFVRIKNISLAYDLPAELFHHIKFAGSKIYLQVQNLFTFTKYRGSDPENNGSGRLPPLRMVTAGFQINL